MQIKSSTPERHQGPKPFGGGYAPGLPVMYSTVHACTHSTLLALRLSPGPHSEIDRMDCDFLLYGATITDCTVQIQYCTVSA